MRFRMAVPLLVQHRSCSTLGPVGRVGTAAVLAELEQQLFFCPFARVRVRSAASTTTSQTSVGASPWCNWYPHLPHPAS
eukprot:3895600-Rhodomonas_salina.1